MQNLQEGTNDFEYGKAVLLSLVNFSVLNNS